MPEASRQNATHATVTRPGVSSCPSAPAAPAAAITRMFLIHCLGRIVATTAPRRPRRALSTTNWLALADSMAARYEQCVRATCETDEDALMVSLFLWPCVARGVAL